MENVSSGLIPTDTGGKKFYEVASPRSVSNNINKWGNIEVYKHLDSHSFVRNTLAYFACVNAVSEPDFSSVNLSEPTQFMHKKVN